MKTMRIKKRLGNITIEFEGKQLKDYTEFFEGNAKISGGEFEFNIPRHLYKIGGNIFETVRDDLEMFAGWNRYATVELLEMYPFILETD